MHSRLHASRALNFKIRQCLGLYHTNDDSISESSCKPSNLSVQELSSPTPAWQQTGSSCVQADAAV